MCKKKTTKNKKKIKMSRLKKHDKRTRVYVSGMLGWENINNGEG